jgi:hypothetical protein
VVTLYKSTANEVVVTLSEFTTIDDPGYLFEFKNKETNVKEYCLVGAELSNNIARYNKFIITDSATPDLLNSEVNLSPGDYIYTVYQLSEEQVENLPTINVDSYTIVEGPTHARVRLTSSTPNTFYNEAPLTNTVYE